MFKTKLKVLIVDDNLEWINYHKTLLDSVLEKGSYKIDYEMSAKGGFSRVAKNTGTPYEMIITDLEMEYIQGENYAGEWLIKTIKNNNLLKTTKIIIVSGVFEIHEIAKKHNVDFIPKYSLAKNPALMGKKI